MLESKSIQKAHLLAWLIEYSATLHNLFQTGEDGMTPYQRIKGKKWSIPLPCFAEAIEFKRRTHHKLESRWEKGVFLGVKVDTTERIVGTKNGIFVVQSIKRVPESERYDSELLLQIRGVPWKPQPDGRED